MAAIENALTSVRKSVKVANESAQRDRRFQRRCGHSLPRAGRGGRGPARDVGPGRHETSGRAPTPSREGGRVPADDGGAATQSTPGA